MSESKGLFAGTDKPDPAAFLEQNCKHVEQHHTFLVDYWLYKRWTHQEKFSAREVVSVEFPGWWVMLRGLLTCQAQFCARPSILCWTCYVLCVPWLVQHVCYTVLLPLRLNIGTWECHSAHMPHAAARHLSHHSYRAGSCHTVQAGAIPKPCCSCWTITCIYTHRCRKSGTTKICPTTQTT